jgi:integrase
MKQPKYTYPEIKNRNGDLTKAWYIEFYHDHPTTKEPERFQIKSGQSLGIKINGAGNRSKSKKERMEYFQNLQSELIRQLPEDALQSKLFPEHDKAIKSIEVIGILRQSMKYKSDLATPTISNYDYSIDKFEQYLQKQNQPADSIAITKSTIINYLQEVNGNVNYNAQLTNLKAIFNTAIEKELLIKNPCKGISKKKVIVKNHLTYPPNIATEILNYTKEKFPKLFITILLEYYAFMRPSEVIRLKWENIDIHKKLIAITGHTSKVKIIRTIPIHNHLLEVLLTMPKSEYILGKKYNEDYLKTSWGKLKKQIYIPERHTLYSWKHTGVSKLYSETKDIYLVSKLCGHKSIKTTEIYLRSLGENIYFLDNSALPHLPMV